jgi:hypothetical protein
MRWSEPSAEKLRGAGAFLKLRRGPESQALHLASTYLIIISRQARWALSAKARSVPGRMLRVVRMAARVCVAGPAGGSRAARVDHLAVECRAQRPGQVVDVTITK